MISTEALVVGHCAPLLSVPDLHLQRGRLAALIGPNGVGKTTVLETVAGRLRALAGIARVDVSCVHSLSARDRARSIAYLPAEDPTAEAMPVREAVFQGRLAHRRWALAQRDREDEEAVRIAIATMDLRDFTTRSTGSLSSGEQQRVWIAVALAQRAPNILLDEPTSHLDVRNAVHLMRTLRSIAAAGRCVVVVLHDLNLAAAFAHDVVLIGPGRVVAYGPPDDVVTPALLSDAYGTPMRVVRDRDGGVLVAPELRMEESAR